MKTEIFVTGAISSIHRLTNAISTGRYNCEIRSGMFNSNTIIFKTRKDAYSALWCAFKKLREDKEDARASHLSYAPKHSIYYDSATATIVD